MSYSIVVSNPSAVSSSTNVQLSDALPSNGGLTWTKVSTTQGACSITNNTLKCGLGTVPPGASVSVTVSTDSVTPPSACTDQPNAAAIATADGGFLVQDGGFQRCIPAQLRVVNTPDKGLFQQGGQVSYTIVVKNPAAAGSSAARNVVLTDDLPTNGGLTWVSASTSQGSCSIAGNRLSCLLGNLVAGGAATVVVSSPVTTPASACQPQPNPGASAIADGYLTALDPGWQSCTPPVKIQVVRSEAATLAATLAAAELVTYRYTVTNTEKVGVTDIIVREDNGTPGDPSDDIIVGIIPTLAAGASGVLTWTGPPFKRSGNEIITRLGSAAPGKFTVLSLGGDENHPNAGINCSNATIDGNVGVASYGKFLNMAPCTETGDFYRGERVTYSGPGKLLGRTIVDEVLMNQLRKDTFDAAAHFAGLPVTPSVQQQFPSNGSIKGTVTVTGTPGVNVVKLPGLALNGNLILQGAAGTQFVLNISGTFNLHSGNIVAKGGVGTFDVIYNITNPAASVKTMMPTTAIGVLLAPYNTIDAMDSSNFYGTVIGGYNTVIKLWSGTRVVPPPVPPQPANSTATAYGVPVGVTGDAD